MNMEIKSQQLLENLLPSKLFEEEEESLEEESSQNNIITEDSSPEEEKIESPHGFSPYYNSFLKQSFTQSIDNFGNNPNSQNLTNYPLNNMKVMDNIQHQRNWYLTQQKSPNFQSMQNNFSQNNYYNFENMKNNEFDYNLQSSGNFGNYQNFNNINALNVNGLSINSNYINKDQIPFNINNNLSNINHFNLNNNNIFSTPQNINNIGMLNQNRQLPISLNNNSNSMPINLTNLINNSNSSNIQNYNFPNKINNPVNNTLGYYPSQMFSENNNNFLSNINNNQEKKDLVMQTPMEFLVFCNNLKIPLSDFICSQLGSRVMQKYLEIFPESNRSLLIEKIFDSFEKIMTNTYGNYFFQKLYLISGEPLRKIILYNMKDIFVSVSKNPSGAHVTQSIIEEAKSEEEKKLIMEFFKGHEMELAFDPEGTHVIQKVIQIFREKDRQSLIDVLYSPINVSILSKDPKGVPVLKRLISFGEELKNKNLLINAFIHNFIEIAQNSSGNFIIQYMMEKWGYDICKKIVEFCVSNFEIIAINKFSSKIIFKIIDFCSNSKFRKGAFQYKNMLIEMLFDVNKVISVYKNKYAKFILVKIRTNLFDINADERFRQFLQELKKSSTNLQEGKKYQVYLELYNSNNNIKYPNTKSK